MGSDSKKEKKKSNKKIINILITIIVILIIAISALIVYVIINKDKFVKEKKINDKDNKKIVEPKKEKRDLTNAEKEELISFIDRYRLDYLASKYDGIINEANNRILLNTIYYFDSIGTYNFTSYDASDIKGYISRVFNIDNINFTDILCPIDNEVLYKYLDDGSKYVQNETHPGHGGELLVYDDAHYVISSIKDGDEYKISLLFFYGSVMDGYYVNDEEINIEVDPYVEMSDEELKNFMKDYFYDHIDEYTNKTIYEYTFKKNGNGYYLYSLKNI